MPQLPDFVFHADWGSHPQKRRMACAARVPDGAYLLSPAEAVGSPQDLLERQWARAVTLAAASPTVLAGFDFPIGLPQHYAGRCKVDDFLALLPQLGQGEWIDFYRVAARPDEIHLHRPFYPQRPGSACQAHLLQALGAARMDDLRRTCDLPQPGRRAAAPLFWTLGAQQVGKAAIVGWRDVLAPALYDSGGFTTALWPFSGGLSELLAPGHLVVVEAYPAEYARHFGLHSPRPQEAAALAPAGSLPARLGKRAQAWRMFNGAILLDWAESAHLRIHPQLRRDLLDGFGPSPSAEDSFDAVLGLFGMLNVLLGDRPSGEPAGDQRIGRIEGWILGL